jgi:dTDP-4-dehydrorhamnose reductase
MRILLTGASGQLGAYLLDRLARHNHDAVAWTGMTPVDLLDGRAMLLARDQASPDVVIHAAAISSAEAARLDPDRASRINVEATARLADWSDRQGRRLVFTSTDLVFDGSKSWNREDDPAEPVLTYGRTKREAEPAILAIPKGVVARLSLLYGPSRCGRVAFFDGAVGALQKGEPRAYFDDEFRTPLDLTTAAEALVLLAEGEMTGIYHVAGRERMSRFELMRRAATALGLDPSLVVANRRADVAMPEPRPADVSLDTTRLASAFPDLARPSVEEALAAI